MSNEMQTHTNVVGFHTQRMSQDIWWDFIRNDLFRLWPAGRRLEDRGKGEKSRWAVSIWVVDYQKIAQCFGGFLRIILFLNANHTFWCHWSGIYCVWWRFGGQNLVKLILIIEHKMVLFCIEMKSPQEEDQMTFSRLNLISSQGGPKSTWTNLS